MGRGVKLTHEQEDKIRASFLLTGSISKTAKEMGIAKSTVHAIVHTAKTALQVLKEIRSVTEMDARRLSWVSVGATVVEKEMVHRWLQHELAKEHPDASEIKKWAAILQALDISYGIDVEKARLLNEQATQITARADELVANRPPGVTVETMTRIVRLSIGSEEIHPTLLAEAAAAVAP